MNVTIYGKDHCSYTKAAKEAFAALCVPVTYIALNETIRGKEIGKHTKTSSETVPVIIINGKWIGGFDQLKGILKQSWSQCESQPKKYSNYQPSF